MLCSNVTERLIIFLFCLFNKDDGEDDDDGGGGGGGVAMKGGCFKL